MTTQGRTDRHRSTNSSHSNDRRYQSSPHNGNQGTKRSSSRRSSRSSSIPQSVSVRRVLCIVGIFVACALVILGRIFYLTVIVGPQNAEDALASRTVEVTLPAKRGTIYDRNGTVLATSVDAKTLYCNPTEVTDPQGEAQQLANLLGGDAQDYADLMQTSDTSFVYLYHKADESVADQIADLNLDGVHQLADSKRVYPCGQTAGQIVGMIDIDGNGLSGLELYYDDTLKGTDGSLLAERGASDLPIAGGLYQKEDAQDGHDVVISIDISLQASVEERLSQCVSDLNGASGNAVLYDASNGDIVACASTPYLDPSNRENIEAGSTELASISSAFEPGSIFKTVSATAICEADVMEPDDTIYCPASLQADEYTIKDEGTRSDETMSLRSIIARSSNVGISLATAKLGFRPLYNDIIRYGLTDATGVDYPGESSGYCSDESTWSNIQADNISFGQGITVTPLQMTRFYGALVNDGVACTPHFLLNDPETGASITYDSSQIIENTSAIPKVVSMLQGVVSGGTGTGAQITGYAPAGKTGTAEYAGDDGKYISGMNNISFVGFLPNTNSKLVCFVGVKQVPGDGVTTPAFKDIMTSAIGHYRITPQ